MIKGSMRVPEIEKTIHVLLGVPKMVPNFQNAQQ